MALAVFDFESQYLTGNTKVGIIMPDKPRGVSPGQFYLSKRKYKVLWLLHGGSGDYSDWIRKSNVELYACEHELIVVMPSASNSWYTDCPGFGNGYYFEKYFVEELMPLIHHWFPASDKREDNYIAGLAMGGRGAFKLAIEHPEKFCAAANFSGDIPDWEKAFESNNPRIKKRTSNMTAQEGSRENLLKSGINIRRTLKQISEAGRLDEMPKLFFAGGKAERRYSDFIDSIAFGRSLGFTIYQGNSEGGHSWEYWDKELEEALQFFGFDTKEELGNVY